MAIAGLPNLLGRALKTAKALPLTATVGTMALGEVAEPVVEAAVKDPLNKEVKKVVADQRNNELMMRRMNRLQMNMAMNTARLARLDPHLYNEVLAGRRLARGTRVFGGQPRTDLMELLAAKMSTGEIGPEPTLEDKLGNL